MDLLALGLRQVADGRQLVPARIVRDVIALERFLTLFNSRVKPARVGVAGIEKKLRIAQIAPELSQRVQRLKAGQPMLTSPPVIAMGARAGSGSSPAPGGAG